ncbi:NRDE family protein [Marinobacter caseinilyticus]|uniref:NRDE family protein n=1 Tax=Marinobacter caseinilyticus TaxID=2692195 RepID=UPI00140C9E73|nr:NRDE family protein [Marinobacter caseinilyticus]
MCLILFAVARHPQFPLVVAANRDEFFARPTTAMHWWREPDVLAGQDQLSGGTWLAVSREGAVAAVTNVRGGGEITSGPSRGALPLLALTESQPELNRQLRENAGRYAGFNLVALSPEAGWYFSNRDAHPGRNLHRGLYGLSNHLLQSPWPKLLKLRDSVGRTLAQTRRHQTETLHATLVAQLQDDTPAPDHCLPDTGVGLAMERFLSSPFIRGRDYGTRATTIVTVDTQGQIVVTEQNWLPEGQPGQHQQFSWRRPSSR